MESLPEEMLFTIFQNLHPLELIHLSRVNRRWHDLALNPRLHRSVDFNDKLHFSSAKICKYIGKYKHSLQELNLQECYWLKGGALSTALQKCRKLTSLNVLGCSVSKKTLCSVLRLNSNLTTLAWSITASDLYLPPSPISRETFRDILASFCRGLATGFAGLDRLMIRFPLLVDNLKFYVPFLLNLGMPLICHELSLKRFALQWFDVTERAVQCVEIVIEGSDLRLQKRKQLAASLTNSNPQHSRDHHLTGLQALSLRAAGRELEQGTLHTFVLPHFDYFVQSDDCKEHLERLATKSSIVNMDLGALGKQDPDRLTTILGAQSLRYLNLTGMNIIGHMLQVIATSSPNLKILNLQDCRNCLTPIQGLESLALCCTNMAQLNLKGVHYGQDSNEKPNSFMAIISKFTNLTSLSICNCVLGSVANKKSSKRGLKEEVVKRTKRVCHGKNLPGCQSSYDPASGSTSVAAVDNTQTETPHCELGGVGTFDYLTRACSKITEFELIRTSSPGITFVKSYYTSFNRALADRSTETCYTIKSTYDTLSSIANWKGLQRLTLAAPFMQCSLECLVTIAQNCPNLQFLSLATLANLSHSGNVSLLQQALSCCHQLRDFRLEQPLFKITESFLLSLGESKHLERVCIIARDGPMKIDPRVVVSLFEKCFELYYFHVLCDITIKAGKVMMDSVKKRFLAARPGLLVSVVPFRHSSTPLAYQVQIVKSVPVVHLKDLFLFGTSVATSIPA